MNTSLTMTPVAGMPVNGLDGNALMEKLRAKATNAVRDAFLDSLTPEEYNAFITQAVDEFINGPVSQRFEMKLVEEYIYTEEQYNQIAATCSISRTWEEGKLHHRFSVMRMRPVAGYDPTNDPGTLKGMLRTIVREQVNKQTLQEIMDSPEMKTKFMPEGGPFNGSYHLFEEFVTKFLQDNMALIIQAERQAMISSAIQLTLNNMRNNNGRGY